MVSSRVLQMQESVTHAKLGCKALMSGMLGLKYCENADKWAAAKANKVVTTVEKVETSESTW